MTDASTTGAVERLCNVIIRHVADGKTIFERDHAAMIDTMRALVAERDAAIQRAEAAELELHTLTTAGIIEVAIRNPSVMEYMKHWEGRAERAEAEITQFCAQAALAWEAGRDDAAVVVAEGWAENRYQEEIDEALIALTPPADLSAALTARLDAEWNAAIEAAALEAEWRIMPAFAASIRALRRAAPTEGEA